MQFIILRQLLLHGTNSVIKNIDISVVNEQRLFL